MMTATWIFEVGETGRIRVEIDVDSLSGLSLIDIFLPGSLASDVEFRLEQRPSNWTSDGSPQVVTGTC